MIVFCFVFCFLFLLLWSGFWSLWWGSYKSREWYFPDVLQVRQVELACLGIVLLLGARMPMLAVAPVLDYE